MIDSSVADVGRHIYSRKLIGISDAMNRYLVRVARSLSIFGSVLVMIMAFLLVADVISRHFFNHPLPGAIELEQFMLATVAFLGLSWAMVNNSHVRVDLLAGRLSAKTKTFFECIFSLLGLCFFAIVTWQNSVRMMEAFEEQEIGMVTGVPLWPILAVVVVGGLALSVVLIRNYLESQAKLIDSTEGPLIATLSVYLLTILVFFLPAIFKMASLEFDLLTSGIVFMIGLLILMFLGFPIAFAMGLIGFLGMWYLRTPETAIAVVKMAAYDSVADYFLCVIPFFVLMGMFCFKSGISKDAYNGAYKWFGAMPGGLAISTVAGCGAFAAICGDSMATAATMGSVSLPEMKKYRYQDALATGALAAGGTLGILIPPSIGFIVYSFISETSVAKLFMAGMIPGFILAALFGCIIYVRCRMNPALGPSGPKFSMGEKIKALKDLWMIALLFVIVIGGIYTGIMTPTEAGGMGTVGALLCAVFSRDGLSWKGFWEALDAGMQMTAMIFCIIIGVSILGYFVVATEIPLKMSDMIVGMNVNRYVVFFVVLILYLALGMVMNIIPMIMLTMPIIFPTIKALGFDPIWFGVVTVIMMEMGQITPPVGMNVFVISGVAKDVPMITIFKGVTPFLLAQIALIILLILFPDIALFLANTIKTLAPIG